MAGKTLTPLRAILYGGIAAAALDILDPIIYYGLKGAAPVQILQSVASGLLGPTAAHAGGWGTGLLGLGLHTAIMLVIAAIFILAAHALPILKRLWFISGPLYGLGVYFVMNYLVVPMSAAHGKPPSKPEVIVNLLFAHMILVGLTLGYFAGRTRILQTPA
ncbi:hypothetical protein BH11PSE2_BH11PSE2_13960 [soil metagenome]